MESSRFTSTPTEPRAHGGLIAVLLLLALILMAVAANALVALSASAAERYTVAGDHVSVYNLAGKVAVEAGSGSQVEVLVTRGGQDAGQLEVETGTIGSAQTIRVIYPENRIVYPALGRGSNCTLRVNRDGTFGDRDSGRMLGLRREVRISGSGSGMEAFADLVVRVPRGQRFSMYLGAGHISASNVDGHIRLDGAAASVDASSVRGTVTIDTGSGDVSVTGATGDLSVDTGSGGVELEGVHGGSLSVDTGSGGIDATDLEVADCSLDTGSGAVRIAGLSSPQIHVDTGSGSVELALTGDANDIDVDTGSGSIVMRVPGGFGAELSVETGSGSIDAHVPVTLVHRGHGSFRGRIGDGRGQVVLETGSGDVTIAAAR